MRVLLTNNTLAGRAGTELYVRDVALALQRRGHEAIAYSATLGGVAAELRDAGVTVTDDLGTLDRPPDVIHGHHHLETMTALLSFPGVPGIAYCHSSTEWQEWVADFPRLRRYVAVDEPCRTRIVETCSIAAARVVRILNFVDLLRFQPRAPLPDQPRRALLLDGRMRPSDPTAVAVRAACDRAGLALDVAGEASGKPCPTPESVLPAYDVVFARARSALEAMAVGAAVILVGVSRIGPRVTSTNVERLRPLNFGRAAFTAAADVDRLTHEIAGYDARDAAAVSARIRNEAGLDAAIDTLVDIYERTIDEQRSALVDHEAELAAVARYLLRLAPDAKHGHSALAVADDERRHLEDELYRARRALSWRWRLRQRARRIFGRA